MSEVRVGCWGTVTCIADYSLCGYERNLLEQTSSLAARYPDAVIVGTCEVDSPPSASSFSAPTPPGGSPTWSPPASMSATPPASLLHGRGLVPLRVTVRTPGRVRVCDTTNRCGSRTTRPWGGVIGGTTSPADLGNPQQLDESGARRDVRRGQPHAFLGGLQHGADNGRTVRSSADPTQLSHPAGAVRMQSE
ncbi:DUF6333 family protein [Streptomyces sp. NPDC048434]|uniref:DUF6333 family protein n=1 Tax=Streptomyces sp. NPDC048434 TaxID=3365549 RepID=UPI0037216E9C